MAKSHILCQAESVLVYSVSSNPSELLPVKYCLRGHFFKGKNCKSTPSKLITEPLLLNLSAHSCP